MSSTDHIDDGDYLLKRDFSASMRLTAQHYILTQRRAPLLHPSILSATGLSSPTSSSSKPLEILDLGCGNGVWSQDIISKYGDGVNITALDVSAAQFPPKVILPSNLHMSTYNFFSDVPEQYIGKFDIIHTRFIVPGLVSRPDEIHKVMENMLKMLKRGGWLHWHEGNDPIMQRVEVGEHGRIEATGKMPAIFEVIERFTGLHSKAVEISAGRQRALEDVGFVDVEVMEGSVRGEGLKYETDVAVAGFEEVLDGMLRVLPNEEAKEELKKAYKTSIEVTQQDVMYSTTIEVVAARKP